MKAEAIRSIAALGLLFLGSSLAKEPRLVLHEKREALPPGWSHARKRKLDDDESLPLRFGLKQANTNRLSEFLENVSNPGSRNYGKHWTSDQVASVFSPSNQTLHEVAEWLIGSGFDQNRLQFSASRGWITVNATAEEAETLLDAEYYAFSHDSGSEHVACMSYHLPSHIIPHVDVVLPSVHFDAVLSTRTRHPFTRFEQAGTDYSRAHDVEVDALQNGNSLKNCHIQITPQCIRALYNITYTAGPASVSNSFGIVEYTPQAYLQDDLDMFFRTFSENKLIGRSPVLASIDGGIAQTVFQHCEWNCESNLDLSYGMALVSERQNVTLYQVGDMYVGASFNNFLDAIDGSYCFYKGGDDPVQDGIYPDTQADGGYREKPDCGIYKPTNVISTSYGLNEANLSPAYTSRQCDEYGKLGLMGITMLFSSGDNGVAGYGGYCRTSDGNESENPGSGIFSPGFPSGCPYVTSIGATQMNPGSSIDDKESACETEIYSGGGFSNHFATPSYQKDAVSSYLDAHNSSFTFPPNVWNSTGTSRGFPDMSANGANYVIVSNGELRFAWGTSASTPVVAAMLTLINDARIARGKSPIGFINPVIYSHEFRSAFNDITTGRNPGCGTNGFNTAEGWDPVTGLGTPNFQKLLEKWLALP